MRYIEEKAGGKLACKKGDTTELQTAFNKNSKDSKLNALIDSLMNTTVRYDGRMGLRHITVENFSKKTPRAKEAYRVAFTVLPDFCVELVGGIDNKTEIWVEYWNNHEHRERVENAVIELSASMEAIIESLTPDLKALLPDDVDMSVEVNIHLIVDGDGAFFYGNHSVMDLVDEGFVNSPDFFATLKHEIHHIYYGNWFQERFGKKERSRSDWNLYAYQRRFITEGIATLYGHDLVPLEVQQMYANKDLIAELFDEWISLIRGLKGDSPEDAREIIWDYLGERSFEWQKKYWPGDPDNIIQGYRPTVFYYVSYNLYNAILEHGGHEKLKYVIENPDKLPSVYNELYSETMLIPRIPDDVVMLWQNNF